MPSETLALQRATARLRIRQDAPDIAAEIGGYFEAGAVFQPEGRVQGANVHGNATWFELSGSRFVWAGATAAVADSLQLTPSITMAVHRRADGTIQVLANDEREKVFGKFDYNESQPKGAIKIDPAWVATNIVTIETPILAHTGHATVEVHTKAADPFKRVFDKIDAAGLGNVIKTCAGTWVPRHMGWDSSRALSAHSWGAAIDLNAGWNGYGSVPAPLGATGSTRELIPLFESEGFGWGGYFEPQKFCDGMHFELSRLDL